MTKYYYRFPEQDGSWSPWYECSQADYQFWFDDDEVQLRRVSDEVQP